MLVMVRGSLKTLIDQGKTEDQAPRSRPHSSTRSGARVS